MGTLINYAFHRYDEVKYSITKLINTKHFLIHFFFFSHGGTAVSVEIECDLHEYWCGLIVCVLLKDISVVLDLDM